VCDVTGPPHLLFFHKTLADHNGYWDTETSGQSTSGSGMGKTTTEMMTRATFTGWDCGSTWHIYEG
jgi:hypothetical protein